MSGHMKGGRLHDMLGCARVFFFEKSSAPRQVLVSPGGHVPDRKLPSLPDLAVNRAGVGGDPVAPLGGAAGDVSVSSRSTPEIISLVPKLTMTFQRMLSLCALSRKCGASCTSQSAIRTEFIHFPHP